MARVTGRLIATLWGQQLSLLMIISVLLLWIDAVSAYSALLGGLVYWVPNVYFTLYAFRYRGARAATSMLRSIYKGESGKFVLTVVGFAIVFSLVRPIDPIAMFLAYIAMIVTHCLLVSRWP